MKLVLGPLLRHTGVDEATIWVQTDGPCEVTVRAGESAASDRSWSVEGHHYALVHVDGLRDPITPYEVLLDGERVWPQDDEFPPSVIRTHRREDPVQIVFGSCRVAAPHEPPHTLRKDEDPAGREVDALRGLALEMMQRPPETWPHALLMLGDQIYADEPHPGGRREARRPAGRDLRRLRRPLPRLLERAGDPLAALDRAQRDDLRRPRRPRRLEHVDRMGHRDAREGVVAAADRRRVRELLRLPAPRQPVSPTERGELELYAALRAGDDDATERLRAFAKQADEEVEGTRWSFCRDIGPARLVMVDSRAGRVLDPGNRAMVDGEEWDWIKEHATGDVDHLLIGTSLPLFMGPAMHWLESWNERTADGAWGKPVKKVAEKLREALDLEHWPAWQESFRAMCELLQAVGSGQRGAAPSTICVLSGDVHHAYLAEVGFPAGSGVTSSVWQAVCSPFRNPLDTQRAADHPRRLDRAPAAGSRGFWPGAPGWSDPPVRWRLAHESPWFNNQVAWLELDGRRAKFVLEKALPPDDGNGDPRMERVFERSIEPNAEFARA